MKRLFVYFVLATSIVIFLIGVSTAYAQVDKTQEQSPSHSTEQPDLAATLRELQVTGSNTPASGLKKLQSFTAATLDAAPVLSQARYYTLLADYALLEGKTALANQSIGHLNDLGNNCSYCRISAKVLVATKAIYNNDLEKAGRILNEIKIPAPISPALKMNFLETRAAFYGNSGLLTQASIEETQALALADKLGLKFSHTRILSTLVGIYAANSKPGQARRFGEIALEAANKNGSLWLRANILSRLSYLDMTVGDHEKQFSRTREILRITANSDSHSIDETRMNAKVNLAAFYIVRKQYAKAMALARSVQAESRSRGDRLIEANALTNIAQILAETDRVAQAITAAKASVSLAHQVGNLYDESGMTEFLAEIYLQDKQYQPASAALKQVIKLNHKLSGIRQERILAAQQESYQVKLREEKITRLSAENARREAQLLVYRTRIRLGIAVVIVILLLLVLASQQFFRTRARNNALSNLNERLSDESRHDELSGAANRRHFREWIDNRKLSDQGWLLANRSSSGSVALFLLDIDHFKKINDERSHQAGDAIIRQFAERLSAAVRPEDVIVRWGGEEFIVLIAGAPQDELKATARRLQNAATAVPFRTDTSDCHVRCSGGAVWIPRDDHDWNRALRLADAALYAAKRTGRDRIVLVMSPTTKLDENKVMPRLQSEPEFWGDEIAAIHGTSTR